MKLCPACNAKYEDSINFCAHDGEVLEDDPSSLVGTVLDGQYQIERMLGKGGMGAVYLARHILLGDRVAVKVLPPQMRSNAEWLRRFRREGQAARRFRHPNAVTVYDLRTTTEGLIYLVMEYVEGHTLDVEMKTRGRFTCAEAFAILEPVLGVLNAAHATGVIHRDLKPENIMISRPDNGQMVVKLLDLGIAKIKDIAGSSNTAATSLTVAGQMLGTPYYMSPEQWGEPSRDGGVDVDGRTDIYSLGAVFYEIIAGRRPFGARTLSDLRSEHVFRTPTPLHELFPEVPEAFSRSIGRAMSKDRGDRQATAGEFAEELREALNLADGSLAQTSDRSQWQTPPGSAEGTSQPEYPTYASHGTADQPQSRGTSSDVTAATIISGEPIVTSFGRAKPSSRAGPLPVSGVAETVEPHEEFVHSGPAVDNATAPATPKLAAGPKTGPGRSIAYVAGALLSFFVIVAAIGGVLFWRQVGRPKPDPVTDVTRKSPSNPALASDSKPSSDLPGSREILRYWIEAAGGSSNDRSTRMAETPVLKSGQSFRFHVLPSEDGYLYILGLGRDNRPYTFLTAKPIAMSGLKSNRATAGSDLAFPNGAGNWITLDKSPGLEKYIFVFSSTPLGSPAFLTNAANQRPLSAAEEKELDALRASAATNPIATDVTGGDASFVSVKTKAHTAGEQPPVVFDVSIEHR